MPITSKTISELAEKTAPLVDADETEILDSAATSGQVANKRSSMATLWAYMLAKIASVRVTLFHLAFPAPPELTLDTNGAITITRSNHSVDTFSDAASDRLITINGGTEGDWLLLRAANAARTIMVGHGDDNILTWSGTDLTLDETRKVVPLYCDGTNWIAIGVREDAAVGLTAADVVNNLTTGGTAVPGSAENDKTLKGLIDALAVADISGLEADLAAKLETSSVVNNLTAGGTAVPGSAENDKTLKGLIDDINTLLTSDESTLDDLQEIVDYIQLNRSDLDALGIASIAGLQTALDAKIATASIVNDLTTGGTTVPGSAEQLKALKGLIDALEVGDISGLSTALGDKIATASIVNDLTTGGTTVPGSAEQLKALKGLIDESDLVGRIVYLATSTVPTGYLKANGALINRVVYADLFAVIGTTFGSGDGSTTFALPDLRGEFLRGWDDGRGIDAGRAFGSAQSHAIEEMSGTISDTRSFLAGSGVFVSQSIVSPSDRGASGSNSSRQVNFEPSTQVNTDPNETRPRNVALLACIRY